MTVTDEYLANNAAYAASFSGPLSRCRCPRRATSRSWPAWTPD